MRVFEGVILIDGKEYKFCGCGNGLIFSVVNVF